MTGVVIILVVLLLLVVLVGLWAAGTYNSLVRRRNTVQESWRQVDVELTRRHDLIPNLVETVKGYATHERETFDAVIRARNAAVSGGSAPGGGASLADRAEQEGQLSAALGRLFALSEAYPDLKANQNFLSLQNELSQTEDRIANGRRYYNANVREFNTKIESFPSNFVAGMFSFKQAEYFEAQDPAVRAAPQVSFGSAPAQPPAVGGPGNCTTGPGPQDAP